MPPLINPKHEIIAQSLSKGASLTQAYIDAYSPAKREHASSAAARLMAKARPGPLIRGRVDELRKIGSIKERQLLELEQQKSPTKSWVLEMLMKICYMSFEGGSLGTATRAVEMLGKEIGMFAPPKAETKAIDWASMTLDEMEALIRQLEADDDIIEGLKAAETLEVSPINDEEIPDHE